MKCTQDDKVRSSALFVVDPMSLVIVTNTHIQNNALTLLATSEHGKTQLTDHDYPSMRCKCNCIHTCVCCRCALVKMPLINTCRSAKPAQARSEVTAFLTKSMGYLGDLQATGKTVRVQCCQRMCV